MQRNRKFSWFGLMLVLVVGLRAQAPAAQKRYGGPPSVKQPATPQDFDRWRRKIREALFIDDPLPGLAPRSYGSFSPTPDVIAERVTYGTSYGMRVPAIVYRPAASGKHRPGLVIVI
jgi:hypothetical protein